MSRPTIMVMAGGTGGHVFPALAVADRLRAGGWPVVWLGTRQGIEARVVPAAGFEIEWLEVRALRGKGIGAWFAAPFRLLAAVVRGLGILRRRRPAAVLGMGGYVTGPFGIAAWLSRRPLVIHEQNSIAGLTNRILARFARRILTGFPETLPRGRWVGNPVRRSIAALPAPAVRLAGRSGPLRVLILGGSQGARALNRVVPEAIASIADAKRPEIRHQCGERLLEEAREAWARTGIGVDPVAFIDDMAEAYAWADVVVCRAGALTVAELAAAGVASVLVPFPAAVDDHQTGNARFLADAGAAEIVPEHSFVASSLVAHLEVFAADRARVLAMAEAARAMARPDAAADLTDALVAVAEGAR